MTQMSFSITLLNNLSIVVLPRMGGPYLKKIEMVYYILRHVFQVVMSCGIKVEGLI
jgi:hypothetical protein